jgi:hypothetical protein
MTNLYTRTSGGYTVAWTPDNTKLAEQAMTEVMGEIGVEVSASDATAIRERYQELLDATQASG